jgi:nucleoside-diphosphate-sugar epimerase
VYYDVIRMLSRDGRPTPLGDAIAHYGRIAKTLHILRRADEPAYRRKIKVQANLQVRPGRTVPDGVTPVEGDILDAASLDGVTDVVHMAALFRTQDTDAIRRTNVEGTRNLIAATKAQAPRRAS